MNIYTTCSGVGHRPGGFVAVPLDRETADILDAVAYLRRRACSTVLTEALRLGAAILAERPEVRATVYSRAARRVRKASV